MDYERIEATFKKNVDNIFKLMSFDRVVLNFAISGVKDLQDRLRRAHKIENPRLLAENTLQMLENIRSNDSLKPQYQVIYNQCIVLLVSVFASSISDIFRQGINDLAQNGDSKELRNEELKISVSQLLEFDGEIKEYLGNFVAEKNDLSFQDMKSIGRAFKTYFGFTIDKNIDVNNIIMAQAGRHVIVHDSSRINERLVRQVSGAKPRTLKPSLSGSAIQFSDDEVRQVADSMTNYLINLRSMVESRIAS
ncbi:hypothetical protein [Marinobacter sp. CHS3-4]|uniref:hypothetical protein n=1 Tax=Marinobacter sp. CHS3-4 TaxID=3045174 RepID=UPI0024B53ECF|nr:hypothetical protein [Marinobacter sp. CHS3-4]MDI9244592.1 hypothetical protein [Marinobacter sp. CHS3-4]